ncbi:MULTISPECIES: hypothetical protein [Streptomyces]|uniref:Sulfotransferase family protein n=1 Tax=Streptomyces evansiae TaxID=3075535 RepID=A0ABU2QV28_9ACTN|nr:MULTISPECIES: hypothetical protein [unclassified Streptomyces]MDT0408311.1 hypothetical protein [Streptomyces sp. DSM 41979]SCE20841.1 hypothetical protein GA0115252_13522 [Streptomyces sp. DfronAA-171]
MTDVPFDPTHSDATPPNNEGDESRTNGSGGWLHRLRTGTGSADRPGAHPGDLSPFPAPPQPGALPPTPRVHETDGAATHVYGDPEVVAHHIEQVILETRKRDLLEGVEQDRERLLDQPFVRGPHWDLVWEQIVNPVTGRPRQPIIVIVAPRSCGSTTFALRLLAEHTADESTLVQLDADWDTPRQGRLPLEKAHAYQLDLKHPENDQVSTDFLNALSKHASHLRDCRSYLALTVAQDLWKDHRLRDRDGIQIVHLQQAPDAQRVVEAHLTAYGYDQLATSLRSFYKATTSLRGLTAVAAVRAAHTVVMVWREHGRTSSSQSLGQAEGEGDTGNALEDRIIAALTDWRGELDSRFGELNSLHEHDNPSLTVEDRCLLLALAVQQSAPMPIVARSAAALLAATRDAPGTTDAAPGFSPPLSALAGRGMRRRIQDVGGRVDLQDTVVFDRPAYGRAVLEYVWDNYDVMRKPLLTWLVATAQSTDPEDHAVAALAELTVRHGTVSYLTELGELVSSSKPEVLGAVLEKAVRNEHVGRLAWAALYGWAAQRSYAPAVIALCQRILEDSSTVTSLAKRAMVRLRRVAHKNADAAGQVLAAYDDLVQHPTVAVRLVAEVQGWQQGKASARGGALAFLALMTVRRDDAPWLVCAPPPDIDVQRALNNLLSSSDTAAQVTSRLTDWIRSCAGDPSAYTQLRGQLLPALRGHNMFEAGMKLMNELRGISTVEGVSVADDFYNHLVDSRLRPVFPLEESLT